MDGGRVFGAERQQLYLTAQTAAEPSNQENLKIKLGITLRNTHHTRRRANNDLDMSLCSIGIGRREHSYWNHINLTFLMRQIYF